MKYKKLILAVIASIILLGCVPPPESPKSTIDIHNVVAERGSEGVEVKISVYNLGPEIISMDIWIEYDCKVLTAVDVTPQELVKNWIIIKNTNKLGEVKIAMFDSYGGSLAKEEGDLISVVFDVSPQAAEGISEIKVTKAKVNGTEIEKIVDGAIVVR